MNTVKKIYKKAQLVSILSVALFFGSCDNFLDVNVSPNVTLDNPPNLILPSVLSTLGFAMGSDVQRYTTLWAQQMSAQAGRQTETYDLYVVQPTEVNNSFRTVFYAGILADAEQILAKPAEVTHPHYFGISKVVKAFVYMTVVDLWGDVPFNEAIKGAEGNVQPKLDRSQDIYVGCLQLLDQAIADLKRTSVLAAPRGDDYIYGGNAARWIRAANSIKLRIYLHWSTLPTFERRTEMVNFITNTPATEFMGVGADNFQHRFDNIARRQNPIHQFILDRQDDVTTSSTIVDMMNSKLDPRRTVYFTPAPFSMALLAAPPTGPTGYLGLRNGTGGGGINNGLSRIHTYARGAVTDGSATGPTLGVFALIYAGNAPIRILTFAEYNFIRAELALRFGAPGNAQDFYRAGIAASLADAGITGQLATDYLTAQGTLTGTPEAQLRQLIEEKFVANYLVGVEPWNDWRRTGFPLLNLIPGSLNPGNNGRVPRALPYPQQEVNSNPNMIQRTSLSEKPVFWDVRTTGQQ
jgi:Starch-binding associating with outer membrane